MKTQSYNNHVRYYEPHHFILLPLSFFFMVACAVCIFRFPGQRIMWICFTTAAFLNLFVVVLLRQHYALGNQNRIVRLEMRLRYFQLTGQRLEPFEEQLGFGRIAALRFASDEELPALLDRTIAENLTADSIKKSIRSWNPDLMRV